MAAAYSKDPERWQVTMRELKTRAKITMTVAARSREEAIYTAQRKCDQQVDLRYVMARRVRR